MAFPTVQTADTQAGSQTSNSTSWTCTYPTNLASGDLILVVFGIDGNTSPNQTNGFTQLFVGNTSPVTSAVMVKVSDGTETGNYTQSIGASEQGCWRAFRITGWYGGSDLTDGGDAFDVGFAGGASSTPDPATCNPAGWDVEDTLWLAVAAADTSRTFSGYPSGYSNTQSQASGGANGASLATAWKDSAAASEDPGTFTISASDDWSCQTVAIRPAAAGNVTVTPTTASLTLTRYAPTVLAPRLVTPTTASLALTTFAPTARLGLNVTPTTASLALTTFPPTVTKTNHQLVTPTTASLALTTFPPTARLGLNVTPTTASLALTTFPPTVNIGVNVVPTTASLTLTRYAPTVLAPRLVTPTTASLALTTFAPTVTAGADKVVIPDPASLALTTFAPTVNIGVNVVPTTASLTLTRYAPTVLAPRLVTPTTASLALTTFAPTVTAPRLVTPTTASLALTTFAPTVGPAGASTGGVPPYIIVALPGTPEGAATLAKPSIVGGSNV